MKRDRIQTVFVGLATLALLLAAGAAAAEEFFMIKGGELERPTGYREWV